MDYKKNQRNLPGNSRGNLRRNLLGAVLFSVLLPAIAVAESYTLESDKGLFANAVKLSAQGKWPEAETIYRELVERHNDWPEPKNNLAILLLKANRLDDAKLLLEQAVTSTPSYRIAQHNRTQLYNYLATLAYDKALGTEKQTAIPGLQLIEEIHQPVKVIEKIVEVVVEKPVIKYVTVPAEPQKPLATESSSEEQTRGEVSRSEKNRNEKATEEKNLATAQNQTSADIFNTVSSQIKQQLLDWSQAWSRGDFEAYVKHYSNQFIPSETGKSFAEWKNIRRARLTYSQGVQVTISQFKVYLDAQASTVLVEFVQHYQSASYSDKVLKQMYMQKQQKNWLILSERTIKTY